MEGWIDKWADGWMDAPPHGGDHVGLGQLHHDGAAPQLVTRVARVPVVLTRFPVDQGVAAATHPLRHACAVFYRGHIFRWN